MLEPTKTSLLDSVYLKMVTAKEMEAKVRRPSEYEGSEIIKIYEGKTIFLTGGTGFVGKMFLEKLLRTCPSINKIYLLVRTKKGKDINERLKDIFSEPMWEPLKKQNPNYRDRVFLICGDIILPDLGLSDESIKILENEVNFIVHCAATVRFDEYIKSAAYMNVRCVRDLIEIAKKMKKLEVFLHVSTAYSQVAFEVDEKFYEPPLTSEKLLSLVEILSDEQLTKITPHLIGKWPNTYTFTKAIAESIIKREIRNLPLVMVRPSIITGAIEEPVPGWLDNYYGATGLFLGSALGIIHSLHGDGDIIVDIVPGDNVVNSMIALVADKYRKRGAPEFQEKTVYNYCSSPEAPIRMDAFVDYATVSAKKVPSTHCIWYGKNPLQNNAIAHYTAVFFYHTLVGYLVDFIFLLIGKKPMAVKGYKKINRGIEIISYFALRQWDFRNNHTQQLWNSLNEIDRKLFPFSMQNFDWQKYMDVYVAGIRIYLLKDPLHTIPEGEKKLRKLLIARYILTSIFYILIFFILKYIVTFIYSMIFNN